MKTYPIELRRRVLDVVENKLGTQGQIARIFGVSSIWIRKLLQQKRQTGSLEPSPRTQGRKPAFQGVHLSELHDFVRRHPDATLEEIQEHFSGRVDCSVVAIHQTLKRLGWRYKKKRYEPRNNTGRITEEFINTFHEIQDHHDPKIPNELKTGKFHKSLCSKQDGVFLVDRGTKRYLGEKNYRLRWCRL
jgi:transposase